MMIFVAAAMLASTPVLAASGKPEGSPLGKFRNTYYYVTLEREYAGQPASTPILDMDDGVIAKVSAAYKRATDIEGSGRLMDGRVINYAGRKKGTIRYHVTSHEFGRGVGNCGLVPFRTIAVDPTRIALGSLVRIDETVGMLLPDGTVHDGLWRAEDVGSAIQHDRLDLFVGDGNQGAVLERAGITNLMPLTLTQVEPPAADNCTTLPPQ